MQLIKFVMREVGIPGETRISAEDFTEYVQYQFLSDGYEVFAQHLEPLYGESTRQFLGYRIFLTLIKNEEPVAKPAKVK